MADIEARLRSLLRLNAAVVGHLHVSSVLERLASSARELSGAEYAAVRVAGREAALAETGTRVDGSDVVEVPIEVTDEPFGTLVVAGHPSGAFADDDVEFLQALAVTAGIAIDKARRYEATRQRERWAQATADVRAAAAAQRGGGEAADGAVVDALLSALPALTGSVLVADAEIGVDGSATLHRPAAPALSVEAQHPLADALHAGRRTALDGVDIVEGDTIHRLGATLVLPAPRSSTDDGMRRALVVARAPGAGPLPPGDIARLDALADETARAVSQASAAGDGSAEAVDDDLSPREREVLLLIADGLSNRQIAHALFLSEKTVKNYITGLLRKLGMQRRTQAAVYGATVRDAL